ncbi:hypothetical protein RI103_34100 [Paraburkholderia sp. FT54]|uniref:hypothetical protein n=1 Tax=Paraburkholderia sp. FT54 TaxID=3074437 RepID=UPI0028773DBD|nr:hypothetical protein [Paraburkholderia sp. FT54]WNC94930.1 hypothetical protein RI103_34100 [Paraburkholderia sp. FT54]
MEKLGREPVIMAGDKEPEDDESETNGHTHRQSRQRWHSQRSRATRRWQSIELGLRKPGLMRVVLAAFGRRSDQCFNAKPPKSRLPYERIFTFV